MLWLETSLTEMRDYSLFNKTLAEGIIRNHFFEKITFVCLVVIKVQIRVCI